MNRHHADRPTAYTPADRARIAAALDAQAAANARKARNENLAAIACTLLVIGVGVAIFILATN